MRKYLFIVMFLTLTCAWGIQRAHAACTLGAGAICVVLQDQFGAVIPFPDANTNVTIITEGTNALGTPADPTWWNIVDGGIFDEDSSADGDIEISAASLAGAINPPYAGDWKFLVESTSGYVNYDSGAQTYNPAANNSVASALQYTLKVTVKNEQFADTITTGSQVTITAATSCNGLVAIDGGANDHDGLQNGLIYVKCPLTSSSDNIDMTISATGYVDATTSAFQIKQSSQENYTSSNLFTYKITSGNIKDELRQYNHSGACESVEPVHGKHCYHYT